ncbi:ubiquitin-conjugating enzyme E2-binding protein [Paraphysoderma sedebokerense]|nr:ubiquitin-conjugating enzyme E2-binding protein [Paraphysoderma sedebokerense]
MAPFCYSIETHSKISTVEVFISLPKIDCSVSLSTRISVGPKAISIPPHIIPLPKEIEPRSTEISNQNGLICLKFKYKFNPDRKRIPNQDIVSSPWSASELEHVASIKCAFCKQDLLARAETPKSKTVPSKNLFKKVSALPSESWMELVDCWICHEDATTRIPRTEVLAQPDILLVGHSYLLVHEQNVIFGNICFSPDVGDMTRGMDNLGIFDDNVGTSEGDSSKSKDEKKILLSRWLPINCSNCGVVIGDGIPSVSQNNTHLLSQSNKSPFQSIRLYKYLLDNTISMDPALHGEKQTRKSKMKQLAAVRNLKLRGEDIMVYLGAEAMDSIQFHACYRFIVVDLKTKLPAVKIWVVSWDSEILAHGVLKSTESQKLPEQYTGLERQLIQRFMDDSESKSVIKVLYQDLSSECEPVTR